jgi:hypothetical protein
LKSFLISLIVSLICPLVFAETFVLHNGRRIEGRLQVEEKDCLRIIDATGIQMVLKKDSLDWKAMQVANQARISENTTTNTVVDTATTPSVSPHAVLTNRDVVATRPRRSSKDEIRNAERELARLANECRSAGASSDSMRVWRTTTYIVHGKKVTVSGYWAHPKNIENAKRICSSANQAQQRLNELMQSAGGR